MFQESALFPWLTAAENVALPMRLAGVGRDERRARADDLLSAVHLAGQGDRRPHELSGGMRQRVALARALAPAVEGRVVDGPVGARDAMTRDQLHDELERLWKERGLTILFVTHNVREASRLGDRIVLLTSRPGRVAATFDVPLPRPRRIEAPEVSAVAAGVTARLREEVVRHAR
jgi:NitT/TauT family transport system ATP-binding protein